MLILLVEDEADLRELLRMLLVAEGYAVAVAADGRAALELLAQGLQPQVVLTDAMMPRLSGPTLIRQLRVQAQALPVILMSAAPELASLAAELQVAWLAKPFDPAQLLTLLERVASPAVDCRGEGGG
jgi:CheY-like chemotaxis protein